MKKLCLALITCAALGTHFTAMADDNHTVSFGFAHSTVPEGIGIKGINGINLKYRYEWDSPVSFITSITYMGASKNSTENKSDHDYIYDSSFKYYSLAAGPAYRFNEFISIYGLVGANLNKIHDNESTVSHANRSQVDKGDTDSFKHTGFMYGAGIQFNPRQDISLDVGYEGSSVRGGDDTRYSTNGFNVGIGYRF